MPSFETFVRKTYLKRMIASRQLLYTCRARGEAVGTICLTEELVALHTLIGTVPEQKKGSVARLITLYETTLYGAESAETPVPVHVH